MASATFERGVNGATIATTDPGAQTPWDFCDSVPTDTLAYDTEHVAHGSLAAKIASGAVASNPGLYWRTVGFGTLTNHYGRLYLYRTSFPAALHQLATNFNIGAGLAVVKITILTTGQIAVRDQTNTVKGTMTNTIAINQFVRIEWHIVNDPTVGMIEVKLFNSPDATVPTETLTTPSNLATGAYSDDIRFGVHGAAQANQGPFWLDDLVAGVSEYPGAVRPTFQAAGPILAGGQGPL